MSEQVQLVSVVVAVLNGAPALQGCLDSIAKQKYTNRELIVIDGGSIDGTLEVIRSNEGKITYWESERDCGIYHAWNKGVQKSKGKYVAFLGCDDRYSDEDVLADMVAALQPGLDLVSGRIRLVHGCGLHASQVIGEHWSWNRMVRWMTIAHPGALHDRETILKHGGFNESFKIAGDYDFFLRLGKSAKVGFCDRIVVNAGCNGVSRFHGLRALSENLRIQWCHPEIGLWRASANYLIATNKYIIRSMLKWFF